MKVFFIPCIYTNILTVLLNANREIQDKLQHTPAPFLNLYTCTHTHICSEHFYCEGEMRVLCARSLTPHCSFISQRRLVSTAGRNTFPPDMAVSSFIRKSPQRMCPLRRDLLPTNNNALRIKNVLEYSLITFEPVVSSSSS